MEYDHCPLPWIAAHKRILTRTTRREAGLKHITYLDLMTNTITIIQFGCTPICNLTSRTSSYHRVNISPDSYNQLKPFISLARNLNLPPRWHSTTWSVPQFVLIQKNDVFRGIFCPFETTARAAVPALHGKILSPCAGLELRQRLHQGLQFHAARHAVCVFYSPFIEFYFSAEPLKAFTLTVQ